MENQALVKHKERPPKSYTPERWAAYMGKPKGPQKKEWSKKKTATARKEVVHTDWDKAHDTIPKNVINQRKDNKGCTRCRMTNHFGKDGRKEQTVTTIGKRPYDSKKRKCDQNPGQRRRVAVMAE